MAFAVLCISSLAWTFAGGEKPAAQKIIVPGVEYFHELRAEGPLSIHGVKVELGRPELGVVVSLANQRVVDGETVRGQAENLPPELGKAVAAVNGDYSEIAKTGDPRYIGTLEGIHIGSGELVHQPAGNVLWFDSAGRPHLETGVQGRFMLTWPGGKSLRFGVNNSTTAHKSEVSATDVVLYTPTFGDSTRTESGLELVMKAVEGSAWLPLKANRSFTGVVEVVNWKGNAAIRDGSMVLSVVSGVATTLPAVRTGDRISFTTEIVPDMSGAVQAIGGGPVLIHAGTPNPGGGNRENLAPRTAIGFNDKYLFLVVVDGRQPKLSVGTSHGALGDLMAGLGCTEAINMDGGGSSTLWLTGEVMNSPSDLTGERRIGNGVIIVKK